MSLWTPLTYETGWSDYGSGYVAGACKLDGDRVFLRGAIVSSGVSGSYPRFFATLPSGFVPSAKETLIAMMFGFDSAGASGTPAGIIVDTSGKLYINTGQPSTTSVLSLAGLSFSVLS